MKEQVKVINNTTYRVTQLNALKALQIQAKLLKILGPALGDLKGAKKVTKEDVKERITTAIFSLIEKFDDDVVVGLIISLFDENVLYEHEGQPVKVSFDMHFTGKIAEMWKVAMFVLEVNFGDLMGKLKSSSPIMEGLEEMKKDL